MTSHVVEMPILTETWEESAIETRFQGAKEAYNAVLSEYLNRADIARDSLAMKKTDKPSSVLKDHGVRFSRTAIQRVRRDVLETGCWIFDHLAANTLDAIAERAALAAQEWLYGPKGRPGFKTATLRRPMRTISASNGFDLEDGNTLRWATARGGNDPLYLDLEVTDRDRLSLQDVADHPTIAVKRKRIKGDWRYFCQVTCNGHPPMTADIAPAHGQCVGVDVGVLRVGVVGPESAHLFELGAELQPKWDRIKQLDRKMDRQKRDANPDKFRADGTAKPRETWESEWQTSKAYERTREERREQYRYFEQHRKRIHEKTANAILEIGTDVVVETRRYKWAQQVGRGSDIRDNAPATFIDILAYKAESVGGSIAKHDSLTGWCVCGEVQPKNHLDYTCTECGQSAPRPILSAFLARYASEDGVDTARAKAAWDERAASLKEPVSANPRNRPS